MKITKEWLKANNACKKMIEKFSYEFPHGVDLTPENIVASVGRYNLNWLAEKVLSEPAHEKYKKATALAFLECEKITITALLKYAKALAVALDQGCKDYKKIEESAWEEYKKVEDPTWEKYEKAAAPVLIAALEFEKTGKQ